MTYREVLEKLNKTHYVESLTPDGYCFRIEKSERRGLDLYGFLGPDTNFPFSTMKPRTEYCLYKIKYKDLKATGKIRVWRGDLKEIVLYLKENALKRNSFKAKMLKILYYFRD
jgi:hypothetical protein